MGTNGRGRAAASPSPIKVEGIVGASSNRVCGVKYVLVVCRFLPRPFVPDPPHLNPLPRRGEEIHPPASAALCQQTVDTSIKKSIDIPRALAYIRYHIDFRAC